MSKQRKKQLAQIANKFNSLPWAKLLPLMLALALLAMPVASTFAQTSTTSLDINTADLQNGLFEGANVIIGALAAIMFLLAGFKFGARILKMIIDTVTNFSF
jgi:hypothetical protein